MVSEGNFLFSTEIYFSQGFCVHFTYAATLEYTSGFVCTKLYSVISHAI